MKKCPKCGTILDDSKKQCYMCGTNLEPAKVDLAENKSIGAIVSGGQDNVFNNGQDIRFKEKDVVKKNNGGTFFSQDSNSQGAFRNDLNSLNSAPADNRSKFKKGLDSIFGNKKFKDETDISSKKRPAKKKEKTVPTPPEPMNKRGPQARRNTNVMPEVTKEEPNDVINQIRNSQSEVEEKKVINQFSESQIKSKEPKPEPEEPKKSSFGFLSQVQEDEKKHDFGFTKNRDKKVTIKDPNQPSFMDKMKGGFASLVSKVPKRTRGYKDGRENVPFSGQMLFNIFAIVFFIGALYYVWNFVINKEEDKTLSGLIYEISPEFKLKSKDKYSRYYVYNDDCTIKINTSTNNSVENYIQNMRDTYGNDHDATVQFEELKIHNYMWSSLAIIYFPKSGATIGGAAPVPRYRYTSILNKGNFFAIVFVNTYEDKTCQSLYEDFSKTLNFKES